MSKISNAKECPFCGSRNIFVMPQSDRVSNYHVHCFNCEARGPDAFTQTEAVQKWNRRDAPEQVEP